MSNKLKKKNIITRTTNMQGRLTTKMARLLTTKKMVNSLNKTLVWSIMIKVASRQ